MHYIIVYTLYSDMIKVNLTKLYGIIAACLTNCDACIADGTCDECYTGYYYESVDDVNSCESMILLLTMNNT